MHPRLRGVTISRVAAYLFTYHAYRSWTPDKSKGYVRRDEGVLPPDPVMAKHYAAAARAREVTFDARMQSVIIGTVRESCEGRGWRLHQACATATHLHILISWSGFVDWKSTSDTLKRHIGIALSRALDRRGPWLSRGQSAKRVSERAHFDHLMKACLPNHQGATFWREDDKDQ